MLPSRFRRLSLQICLKRCDEQLRAFARTSSISANAPFNRLKPLPNRAMVRMCSTKRFRRHSFGPESSLNMKTLTDQLVQYAAYHRDRRNIATHFVGIPMIVVALAVLLSRPASTFGVLPFAVSPAWFVFGAATLYYLALDLPLGAAMALISAGCLALGRWISAASTPIWVVTGVGLFVIGWVFQFVGHAAYEHRKPAFADDLIGLVIGPLFVLAEALFGLGWRPGLREAIENAATAPHARP